jgi:polyisoprenoid-binding protein YceI
VVTTEVHTEVGPIRLPMRFESSGVEHRGGGRYDVKGNLTIRAQTLPIEVDAIVEGAVEDPWGNQRVGISIRGAINRNDYGLIWRQTLASGGLLVGEEVKLMIDITAVGP